MCRERHLQVAPLSQAMTALTNTHHSMIPKLGFKTDAAIKKVTVDVTQTASAPISVETLPFLMERLMKTSKKQDWHPADIKAALAKKGYSLVRIARENGYSEGSPYIVFRKPWAPMEEIIAQIIGVPARKIWPSRYRRDRVIRGPYSMQRRRSLRTGTEKA